jgi:hypothetical protein
MDGSSAQAIYRAEKARAQQERRMSHAQLMAEAKEAFNKMLADAQLARKGGRPRTNPVPVVAAAPAAPAVKPKPVQAVAPAKRDRQVVKPKSAPVKKASPGKKLHAAVKRSAPARAKSKVAAKRRGPVGKKSSPARASRPAHRAAKKR